MAGLDGCGNLTPDRPAGSESINRLSYPGLYKVTVFIVTTAQIQYTV